MTVLDPSSTLANPIPLPGATARIIKQSSGEFRVNDPETDSPDSLGRNVYDQTNARVAMDLDGNFVVTWESVVPNSVNYGSVSDIFARRFSPAGWVDDPYRDIVFTPTGSSALSGHFDLITGQRGHGILRL